MIMSQTPFPPPPPKKKNYQQLQFLINEILFRTLKNTQYIDSSIFSVKQKNSKDISVTFKLGEDR